MSTAEPGAAAQTAEKVACEQADRVLWIYLLSPASVFLLCQQVNCCLISFGFALDPALLIEPPQRTVLVAGRTTGSHLSPGSEVAARLSGRCFQWAQGVGTGSQGCSSVTNLVNSEGTEHTFPLGSSSQTCVNSYLLCHLNLCPLQMRMMLLLGACLTEVLLQLMK